MKILLKNGEKLELEKSVTCADAAEKISEGLARNAVAAKVNGKLTDLSCLLNDGDTLEIVTK